MRIALIHTPYKHRKFSENLKVVDEDFTLSPPIILAYVASIIEKAGHNVILIDAHSLRLTKEDVLNRIKIFKPDLLAFRVETYNFHTTLEWIEYLKLSTKLPVIVGGINMDLYPLETMSYKVIDFGLSGEAIYSLGEFLKRFEYDQDYGNVAGLYYRKDGKLLFNPPSKEKISFDDYPFPARHLLPNEVYHSFVSKKKNFTIMLTQTGCPYRCKFCAIASIRKYRVNPYRKRSWENVVREMEICYYDFGIREIDIFDATFFLDKERDIKIFEEMKKRGIKITWTCRSRVDIVNEDVLKEASKAGLRMVFWGIESSEQSVLDSVNKDIKREQTIKAISLSRKYGIKNLGFLMVGNPLESRESVYKTVDFAKKLKLDYVQICRTIAKPKTDLDDELIKLTGIDWWSGYISGKIAEQRFPTPWTDLTHKELEDLLKKAYFRFYFRLSYIARVILNVASINELIRYIRSGIRMLFHYFYTDVSMFKDSRIVRDIAHIRIENQPDIDVYKDLSRNLYILIPTFRENENLIILLKQIFNLYLNVNVVIIDSEFDGKNEFVDGLKSIYGSNLHIIHLKKKGEFNERGDAIKEGIKYAYKNGADIIVEMDGDFSHHPSYILEFLRYITQYDVVIGRRYKTEGRSMLRNLLTFAGNLYIKMALGIKNVSDCTSGFRCYTRKAIELIDVDKINFSEGTAVLVEMLYVAIKKNLKIKEVGVVYFKRRYGKSKFSLKTIIDSIKVVFYLRGKYEHI